MNSPIRFNAVIGLALLVCAVASAANAQIERVIGIGDFPHGVGDIGEAIAYYRDVVGLELVGTEPPLVAGKMGPNFYDAKMQAVMDVGGAYYRVARFRIPQAGFHLQLVEMVNNQRIVGLRGRRQSSATPTERGSVMMQLSVSNADQWLKKIRDGLHGDLLTNVPEPDKASTARFAFRDSPDGFLLEIAQSSDAPRNPDGIGAAGIVLTAADAEAKLRFYREVLGFDLRPGEWELEPSAAGAGASAGALKLRRSMGRVPGTDVPFEVREYQDVPGRRFYPSTMGQDGVGWLQFVVRDLDSLMKVFIAERLQIVSTGLQPVSVDDGTRRVVVRDPDGVFVELIERVPRDRSGQ